MTGIASLTFTWGVASLALLALMLAPLNAGAVGTVAELNADVKAYVQVGLQAAPTRFARLSGAAIPTAPGHVRAKVPVWSFLRDCQIVGKGTAMFCATPFFPHGLDAERAVEAAIEAALPSGFAVVRQGPNELAHWAGPSYGRAIVLISEGKKNSDAIRYYIWITPLNA